MPGFSAGLNLKISGWPGKVNANKRNFDSGFKILRSFVGWIVEVVRASSRSRQKVWSPVVLRQMKEKKAGIPV